MIRSLFIISDKGDVIIEKHWRGFLNRNVVDHFLEMLNQSDPDADLQPVMHGQKYYIANIKVNDLYLVCPMEGDTPPLLVIEFLYRITSTFKGYFREVTEDSLKDNFVTVYSLLDEMMDSGIPFVTEGNILMELVKPPTLLDLVGKSSISCSLPDGALTNIPWRRMNVKYTANEIYFDITERMDCIFDGNGLVIKSGINADIQVSCQLSGVPDMTLRWVNSRLLEDVSFHPCVRYNRWERERVISFVPPDGNFQLMTYRVNQHIQPPMYCKPQISFHNGVGKMSIMVGPKNNGGKTIEEVAIQVKFPKSVIGVNCDSGFGSIRYDDMSHTLTWNIGRLATDKSPMLDGSVTLQSGLDKPDGNPVCLVAFKVNMYSVSGVKVDSLAVHNEPYKPYKGVRSVTRAGNFEVRM
eukprot:TRINITY_DN1592_c0_g1_i1.p1 TRINITY_DN1592_c0_g1~~TRINITY_DN1592_c0_g1_i1.p1  ORF type:complete len:410 (-),score=130.40 TRINITY_DN1592_c0_g1_i1:97-1326(-)